VSQCRQRLLKGAHVAITVSYKHFGSERGREIGEVILIDDDLAANDPVLGESTSEGPLGLVTLIPSDYQPPGITELGHMTRRKAEALAACHGVPLSEH